MDTGQQVTHHESRITSHASRVTCLVLVFGILLASVAPALAQESIDPTPVPPVIDDQVNAIAKQLYCPVCENIPLDVCGTQACADWRDEIRVMLEQGKSEAEIKAYFADRYGQRVLATPEARGLNVLVWVLPVICRYRRHLYFPSPQRSHRWHGVYRDYDPV